jgi:hypothetical protein
MSSAILLLLCMFVAMGSCLLSHCLATLLLLNNDTEGGPHTDIRESKLTTEELLGAVFSLQSDVKLYKDNNSLLRTASHVEGELNNSRGLSPRRTDWQ